MKQNEAVLRAEVERLREQLALSQEGRVRASMNEQAENERLREAYGRLARWRDDARAENKAQAKTIEAQDANYHRVCAENERLTRVLEQSQLDARKYRKLFLDSQEGLTTCPTCGSTADRPQFTTENTITGEVGQWSNHPVNTSDAWVGKSCPDPFHSDTEGETP